MKRSTLTIITSTVLLGMLGVIPSSATPFFDFYGYSYIDGQPLAVGTVATIPMLFNATQPDPVFPLDPEANEYTVLVEDLEIADIQVEGPIIVVTYAGGTIRIFEDPAKNAAWAPSPPNGLVPASFEDGSLILSGYFTECTMVWNTLSGVGTVQGHVDFAGGSHLGELLEPHQWLFFGGTTNSPYANLPAGYDMAWDPQLLSPEPVSTKETSWGAVKGLFR